MLFHAVEFATEEGYTLCVNTDRKVVRNIEARLRKSTQSVEDDFDIAIGTVEAGSPEAAAHLILAGEWQYSQEI